MNDEQVSKSMIWVTLSAISIGAAPHRGDRLFRLTSALTKIPALRVVRASPMLQEPAIGEPAGEDRAVATIAEEFA